MKRAIKKAPVKKKSTAAESKLTIWSLKITLVFGMHADGPWEAVLEIDSAATLEDLHYAIQRAVGFDDDHLHTFYTARTQYSRERMTFETEDGTVAETTLAELFPLPRRDKLFYWFDFGDDWKFSISRLRKSPEIVLARSKYPRVVSTQGDKPVQYPRYED